MFWLIIVVVGILISSIFIIRKYIKRKVESGTIELNPEVEEKTKLAEQKGIQRLEIDSGKYTMFANWKENGKGSPSIIIYHGNGESLSDWVDTQILLNEMGYNSFVFDYTGFGSSKGKPTIGVFNRNAIAAWEYFCKISSSESPKIAIGHSLGAAILLGSIPLLTPSPDNLVLHAPFSTAREIALHFGTAKKSWVWMMPDVWNNNKCIKRVSNHFPIDIFHSKADQKIPYRMSEELATHNKSVNLHLLEDYGHNAVYEDPQRGFWKKILGID
jgi:alpha-beta hydrolase superfamily lysophospholipase